jgi:Dihydroorotase and related cyclic amidohydrolases
MAEPFDLVIKNARIVRPNKTSVDRLDIAVKDGKIDRIAPDIGAEQARRFSTPGIGWRFPAASMPICMSASISRSRRTPSRRARRRRWAA